MFPKLRGFQGPACSSLSRSPTGRDFPRLLVKTGPFHNLMSPRLSGVQGFTIVEVLLAAALTGVLALGLYQTIASPIKMTTLLDRRIRADTNVSFGLDKIETAIMNAN